MEKRKDNEGEIEKEEANNSLVLFSALRKDIADVLDFLERLKNEENQNALDMDQVEKLKSELAFICTYVQLSYSDLELFEDVMTAKGQDVEDLLQSILNDVDNNVGCKYNMHHVLASLRDNIDHCISLSNLEELSLYQTIVQGGEWNMEEEDTFVNLKYLKLSGVTLAKWEVGDESFPALEKLKLERCHKLEEIPPSFGDIYSLKMIKLVGSPQLEDSAFNIKEYADDMRGGDELQVVGRNNIPLLKH